MGGVKMPVAEAAEAAEGDSEVATARWRQRGNPPINGPCMLI